MKFHRLGECSPEKDNQSGSHHQSQVICLTSVGGINTLVVDLIGQPSRDVIGRLSLL